MAKTYYYVPWLCPDGHGGNANVMSNEDDTVTIEMVRAYAIGKDKVVIAAAMAPASRRCLVCRKPYELGEIAASTDVADVNAKMVELSKLNKLMRALT